MEKKPNRFKAWVRDHPDFVLGTLLGGLGVVLGVLASREMGEAFENARAARYPGSHRDPYIGVLPLEDSDDGQTRIRIIKAERDGTPISRDYTMIKEA